MFVQASVGSCEHALFAFRDPCQQVAAYRHRFFGGACGCRGTQIRHQIGQRVIGFVPHSGNDGYRAVGDGADNIFLVKGHEVFE